MSFSSFIEGGLSSIIKFHLLRQSSSSLDESRILLANLKLTTKKRPSVHLQLFSLKDFGFIKNQFFLGRQGDFRLVLLLKFCIFLAPSFKFRNLTGF